MTITIKNYNCGTITYNGVQHTTTFTANIGDTIEIQGVDVAINNPNATPSRTPYQMLNERTSYTVVSDATFEGKGQFSGNTSTGMYYLLSITDTPFTGVVTQIADESGRVLWSAVKKAKVKLVATPYNEWYSIKASVQIEGVVYDLSPYTPGSQIKGTVWEGELPIGAEIILTNKAARQVFIYTTHIDGSTTKESIGIGSYTYTVVGNANIEVKGIYTSTGPSSYASDIPEFYITELPELPRGGFYFAIDRSGKKTYVATDGMTWGEWVNSAYNVDGYKIGSSGYVYTSNEAFYVTYSGGSTPTKDTKIIANVNYGTGKA